MVKLSIHLNKRVLVIKQTVINREKSWKKSKATSPRWSQCQTESIKHINKPKHRRKHEKKENCAVVFGSLVLHKCVLAILARSLRKHAYSTILKILPSKNENFQIKNSDIFHISAQNIDCGYSLEPPRRGGSNVCPQSMFLGRNKKNNVYPCKPQFYHIKVGFTGVKII